MKGLIEKVNTRFLIALSGILLGLTLVFAKLGALSYVALVPLAAAIFKRAESGTYKMRKAYLDGFIFYMCLDIVGFHWFTYFYPLDFAGLTNSQTILVIALAWIGLSALQSVVSALVFVIVSRFIKTEIYKKIPILLAPFFAVLVTVNEWTQTFTWAGIPWSRIAISQTEMPIMMQSSSLFGSYFLTFIVVLFNFLLTYAILNIALRRVAAISAAAVLLGNMLVGAILFFIPGVDEDRYVKVASIQGNLESQTSTATLSEVCDIYEAQTRKAVEEGAEVILWCEGVFPADIDYYIKPANYKVSVKIEDYMSILAKELGVTIIVGAYVNVDGLDYNTMSAFYPNGDKNVPATTKMHPVPFGEYLPMRDFISAVVPSLTQINYMSYDIYPGKEATVFLANSDENAIKIGSLICFDSIYETVGIESARAGAEIFIIPSNDSWFYDSRALNMHHAQNILRAVEQGKYTVNCGNTGITSIVNNKGVVVADMPIYEEGYVLDTVYASSGRTLYSYIGNLFVYICLALIFVPFIIDIIYKKKKIG